MLSLLTLLFLGLSSVHALNYKLRSLWIPMYRPVHWTQCSDEESATREAFEKFLKKTFRDENIKAFLAINNILGEDVNLGDIKEFEGKFLTEQKSASHSLSFEPDGPTPINLNDALRRALCDAAKSVETWREKKNQANIESMLQELETGQGGLSKNVLQALETGTEEQKALHRATKAASRAYDNCLGSQKVQKLRIDLHLKAALFSHTVPAVNDAIIAYNLLLADKTAVSDEDKALLKDKLRIVCQKVHELQVGKNKKNGHRAQTVADLKKLVPIILKLDTDLEAKESKECQTVVPTLEAEAAFLQRKLTPRQRKLTPEQ